MDLFIVNRYTGDNDTTCDVPDESELKKILIEKVKSRKKLRCKQISSPAEVDKRHINDSLEGHDQNNTCMNGGTDKVLEDRSKKKKKKRKLTDTEEISEPLDKSKKKEEVCKDRDESLLNGTKGGNDPEAEPALESKSFPCLGFDSFAKPTKVKRSIPYWLANPSVVSVDLKNLDTTIDSIPGLEEIFVKRLRENNITHFFPVQKQIIPCLLDNVKKPSFYWPRDICVSAPTGSGKTLAFVLPILQALHKRIVPQIQALVVLPVHDLAVQVYKVFENYSKPTDLKILLLSKKHPFTEEQNMICKKDDFNGYSTLVDIIVTTAGRLVDHLMNTDGISFKHLKYLVIDEADRVMDDMQNDWLYHLNKRLLLDSSKSYQTPVLTYNTLLGRRRLPQKLLFSATLSQDPEKLQQLGLFQPMLFTSIVSSNAAEESVSVNRFIGKYTTPAELQEYYTLSSKAMKPLVVHHLLEKESWRSVLCFVNSVQAAKRLAYLLKKLSNGLKIHCITAKLSPVNRDRMIKNFAKGRIDVLISSDALARGIDIPNVKYVISYNRPRYLKTYIHRIGRTGRAGKIGVSLILLTEKEEKQFRQMIESAEKKEVKEMTVDEEMLEQYTEEYQKALRKLESRLEREKLVTLSAVKSNKIKNKSFRNFSN